MVRPDDPAPRKFVRLPVELVPEGSGLFLFGESKNMSATGMLVVADEPRPPGTRLRFQFDNFRGKASVVWSRQDQEGSLMGLRFSILDPRDRSILSRILHDAASWI